MARIDGKQLRDNSLGIAKLSTAAGQGTVTLGTGSKIAMTEQPTGDNDLVNKAYVDSLSAGLDPKEPVLVATTADLGATYNATGGQGLSGEFTSAPTSIDGITLEDGDRVLVKDQVDQKQNGIYTVTSTTTTWERSTDQDGTPASEVSTGNYTFVSAFTTKQSK